LERTIIKIVINDRPKINLDSSHNTAHGFEIKLLKLQSITLNEVCRYV